MKQRADVDTGEAINTCTHTHTESVVSALASRKLLPFREPSDLEAGRQVEITRRRDGEITGCSLCFPHLNSTRINSTETQLNFAVVSRCSPSLALVCFLLVCCARSKRSHTHGQVISASDDSQSRVFALSLSRRIHLTVARARARALDSSGPTWLTALSTAAAAALRRQQKQKQQPGRRRRRNSSSASNPIARLVLRRRRRFRSSRRFSVSGSLLVTHSRSIWLPARSSRSQLA